MTLSQQNSKNSINLLVRDSKRFLSVKDLAVYLSLSEDTVRAWVKQGVLPFYKFGSAVRFDLVEIEKWTRKRKCSNDIDRNKTFS